MGKLSKAKQICKNLPKIEYRKRERKPPKTQERKFGACGSAGKRIGNVGVWGKLCVFYSDKR